MFLRVIAQIREELRANGIDVYPQKEFDEDAEDRMINDKIRVSSQCQVYILLFVSCSIFIWGGGSQLQHLVPSKVNNQSVA